MKAAEDAFRPRAWTILDRYIGRVFWSSYLVAFLFFFGSFVITDLFGKADDFIETAREKGIAGTDMVEDIGRYYLYNSPFVFLQVAPFITVIGVIVTVTRLLQANELIPILMSGRSLFRTLRPVFVFGVVLTVVMILVQELAAPSLGSRRIALEEYLRNGDEFIEFEQAIEDQQGRTWRRIRYDPSQEELLSASVTQRDGESYVLGTLRRGHYDAERKGWVVARTSEVVRYRSDMEPEREEVDFLASSLDPRQISALLKEAFDLSFKELGYLFAITGQDRYKVLLHYHITFPLTNVLLILLALPFVVRYNRQGMLLGLATAFFFCGFYFGADMAMRGLGENHLHPVLAAWATPIFFGALGISLFDGIRT